MTRSIPNLCTVLWAALLVTGTSYAQPEPSPPPAPAPAPAPAPPAKLEPLPEIPPPDSFSDPDLEPQVTVTEKNGETREETRINGVIAWIKVTPRHGIPYYLIPTAAGSESYIRSNGFNPALSVPMWVLFTW